MAVNNGFAWIHKFASGVTIIAFIVIIVAGIKAQASVFTMTYKSAVVTVVVGIISRIVIQILSTYEEMNGE